MEIKFHDKYTQGHRMLKVPPSYLLSVERPPYSKEEAPEVERVIQVYDALNRSHSPGDDA